MTPVAQSEQLSAVRFTKTQTAVTAVPDKEIDLLISSYPQLTKTGRDMNAWFATHIRRIGVMRFKELADIALRKGNQPDRYFSWLLKNEM